MSGPRVPSGGVTLKRRCTYRPSVICLIVNKLLSLSLSPLSLSLSLSLSEPPCVRQGVPNDPTERGAEYSPSYAGPVRPEAVSPDRALPTLSHFLMSIKRLSLSPNPPLSPSPMVALLLLSLNMCDLSYLQIRKVKMRRLAL